MTDMTPLVWRVFRATSVTCTVAWRAVEGGVWIGTGKTDYEITRDNADSYAVEHLVKTGLEYNQAADEPHWAMRRDFLGVATSLDAAKTMALAHHASLV